MTNPDWEKFKQQLLTERAELEKDLAKVGRESPDRPGEWEVTPLAESEATMRDDVATHLEEMDEREEVEVGLEERYEEVKAALARLEAGTYGVCAVGGEPIESDRLAANPAARTCKAHRDSGDSRSSPTAV